MLALPRIGFESVLDFFQSGLLEDVIDVDVPDLLAWATQNRSMLIPDRPFDLDGHKYLRGIYECKAKTLVVYKAAQMGISEYLLSYVLHACDKRKATCLYIFPNDGLISDFSTARLTPAIEASSYLTSIVHDHTGSSGKKGANRITLKRIRDRFLYMRGGQVKPDGRAPGLKSIDADIVIIDEIDECDPRVRDIAAKRLGHSQLGEMRMVSTPTYPGVGIHSEWLLSDQREWFIPCVHCGHKQTVTIDNIVTEIDDTRRPKAWHQIDGKAYAACANCRKKLDLLVDGEWVATYPDRDVAGFHVKKFFGSVCDLDSIIDGLRSYNQTRQRETTNQDLGEVFIPDGGQLTDRILDANRRDYGHGPVPGARCYAGIDVGSILHMVIREAPDPETGERRQLFAGEVSWDRAAQLLRQYKPTTVVIDGLPETKKSREFQESGLKNQIWLAYYGDGGASNKKEDYATFNYREGTVLIDRTRAMDEMYARVYEGVNTLPGGSRDIPRYYDQLKAPVRVLEKNAKGIETARYVEGSHADHFSHAETYCAVASLKVRTSAAAGKLDY